MKIITENLDLWTSTVRDKKASGRGGSAKRELYGIKKLRGLILGLAVRGLLIEQRQDDESAVDLIARIEKEKATLRKQGSLKKQKELPSIHKKDQPFNIPKKWVWCKLGCISNYGTSEKVTPDEVGGNTWVLELEDVEKETSKLLKRVNFKDRKFKSSKSQFKKGDVIYGKLRPYLDKVIVSDDNGVCTTEMIPFRGFCEIDSHYLKLSMKAPYFIKYANDSTHGMNLPRMGTEKARNAPVPLPPLAEQKRIVAKVDELMALCDQLEQQTEDQIATHGTLVKTLLDALTSATNDAAQFQQAWQTIEANFDLLFTTESSIDHLKQAILQLAVMGKLVPQDPKESAKLDFPKWSSEDTADIPKNWLQVNLKLLGEWRGGGTPAKSNLEYWNGSIPWVCPKDMKRDIVENSIDKITEDAIDNSSAKLLPQNSLLMVVRGMILAHSFPVAIAGREVAINQDMKAILVQYPETVHYLLLSLKALKSEFVKIVERSSHGTCKLVTKDLAEMSLSIPPLNEQIRIVNKTDQLTAICDTIKANLQSVQSTQITLTDCIVNSVT